MCTTCMPNHRSQKRVTDPLKLELQTVESHLMWVLESNSVPLEDIRMLLTGEPSLLLPSE